MIVIYSQDETFIKDNTDAALPIFTNLYGPKLAKEAYDAVKNARVGTSYRKYGGPFVQVVSEERAEWIRENEQSIGPEIC